MKVNEHYLNRYNKFIEHYKKVNETVAVTSTELHHIIPKCLNGTNDKSNLVRLTYRQHFIAHELLYKAYYTNASLSYAYFSMCMINQSQVRACSNERISSRLIENAKIAYKTIHIARLARRSEKVAKKVDNLRKLYKESNLTRKEFAKLHCLNYSTFKQYIREEDLNEKDLEKQRFIELREHYKALYSESALSKREFAELHNVEYDLMNRYLARMKLTKEQNSRTKHLAMKKLKDISRTH